LRELNDELGVDVRAIVSISELVEFLHGREIDGKVVLDDAGRAAIEAYLQEHGGVS
jgi:orotate phosphoribosyltransferase